MKIPSNNLWTQTNEGKKLGVLGDTFNVNLETPGQLQGAKKSVAHLHTDLQTDLGYLLALVYYADNYIAVTQNESYSFSLTTNTTTSISQPNLGVNSDAVICYDRVYASTNSNLAYYDGSWTTSIEALTSDVPHPLEVFDSLPTYKLAIGNGNTVILVDSSGNKDSTVLTLPAQFRVTTMRYRNGYLYVGTRNIYGGEARIFIWNGSGTNAQYEVPTGATWVFSMTPYRSSVAFVTDRGNLLYINGSSAEELASFPVAYVQNTKWQDYQGLQLNGKVFNRGMTVVNDSIYINIDGEVDIGECLEMKSGLWVFNPEVGLYHMATASSDRVRVDSAITISSNEITTAADHYLKTGDGVLFTSAVTGTTSFRTYYVYVTGTNKLKIAKSRKALQNGEYMTISGTGSLMYAQNRDAGGRNHTSGAIGHIMTQEQLPQLFAGEIMFGARVTNLDGTDKYTVQILTDSYNVSRFSTQRIYSDNIEQSWQHAYGFVDGVRLTDEKILVKEQIDNQEIQLPVVGTWLTTNTINVEISGDYDMSSVKNGDEVVITDGYGRGYSTAVNGDPESSSSVTSIVLKESLGTIGESVTFYTTPAKLMSTITNTNMKKGYFQVPLMKGASPWVVLKAEMRGFQPDLAHMELLNKVHSSGN